MWCLSVCSFKNIHCSCNNGTCVRCYVNQCLSQLYICIPVHAKDLHIFFSYFFGDASLHLLPGRYYVTCCRMWLALSSCPIHAMSGPAEAVLHWSGRLSRYAKHTLLPGPPRKIWLLTWFWWPNKLMRGLWDWIEAQCDHAWVSNTTLLGKTLHTSPCPKSRLPTRTHLLWIYVNIDILILNVEYLYSRSTLFCRTKYL